jgi:hypothetical protein
MGWRRVLVMWTIHTPTTRSQELNMFNQQTIRTTRLASFAIACTMTLAMLLSINVLATGDAHAHQLASAQTGAECAQV